MRHSTIVLLVVVAIVLAGCSSDSSLDNPISSNLSFDKTQSPTETVYQYVGYSGGGRAVVRGTLALSVSTVGRVVGRWQLRGTDPGRIGPQTGRGTLTGTLVSGVLSINLNPQNVDNNVLLTGCFSRTAYNGRWEWIGFGGVLNTGTFHAERARSEAADLAE